MLIVDRARRLARAEGGFSLIELLVALSSGVVIMLALFGLLEVATRQTRQVSNKVQSDRLGRQEMNRIVTQLHSACITREAVPVYSVSTENKLVFYNAYSEGAEIKTPSESKVAGEGIYVHEIVYEKTTGKLREKVYPSTEIALPSKVVYSAKAEREILVAEHVTQAKSEGKELPIFQYLKYRAASTTGVNTRSTTLEPIELKGETLEAKEKSKAAGAVNVSGVVVNFEQTPLAKESLHEYAHQGVALQGEVTLALGSPNAETPVKDAPCD